MEKVLTLLWQAMSVEMTTGYGKLGLEMAWALDAYADDTGRVKTVGRYADSWDWRIFCGTPSSWLLGPHGSKNVDTGLFTMFEASQLPEEWVKILNKLAFVVVPSVWVKDVFLQSGVHVPILQVPLGIDTEKVKYIERVKDDQFIFLAQARKLFDRKGLTLAMKAYTHVAAHMPNSELWLKVNEVERWKTITWRGPGKIRLINATYSEDEMRELASEVDCFVYPSHAEGWGLMPLEWMAYGRPVILPRYSAMAEVGTDETCYFVNANETSADLYNRIFGIKASWGMVDVKELAAKMLYVYQNREEAQGVGLAASRHAATFTWRKSAERMVEVLNELTPG